MINVYDTTNIEIKYLQSLKKNHNLTSRQIAEKLETTEAAVSRWFTGKSTPTNKSKEKIYNLLREKWRPGIVRFLATEEVWGGPYFLRVRDILAPYDTWIDVGWSGNEPEIHPFMIEKWEKKWGDNYQVMKEYPNYETFCKESYRDESIYNCTQEHYGHRPDAAYAYGMPEEIAWDVIEELENA